MRLVPANFAFNGRDGIRVEANHATGNTIRGNAIYLNGGLGINNRSNGNDELTPPTITGTFPVTGTACKGCTVDVYSDDADEGRLWEGFTTADDDGNWSYLQPVSGPNLTATATDSNGNTSEFSAPF